MENNDLQTNQKFVIDRTKVVNKEFENEMVESIDKTEFFDILEMKEFNHKLFFDKYVQKKLNLKEIEDFNIMLLDIKKDHKIDIYESLIYFEQMYLDFKMLLKLLDSTCSDIVKVELKRKYRNVR